jgi:cytochrome c biogenesis protein CcdA
MDAAAGLTLGLVVAAFLLGLRHGIDWDHIVAITDIAATTESRAKGALLGTMYVLGHAAVVFALGIGAIALGSTIPNWVDAGMGKFVGVTLILLGVLVAATLIREQGDFRARSRWMILIGAGRGAYRSVRSRLISRNAAAGNEGSGGGSTSHLHEHVAVPGAHHAAADDAGEDDREDVGEDVGEDAGKDPRPGTRIEAPTHSHSHSHAADALEYGRSTSVGIGMLHGVGAETPTQVVVFLAAAAAGGIVTGVLVLLVFLVGLVISNTAITVASAFGFAKLSRRKGVQIAMGAFTAAMSVGIGILFVTGNDGILPAFFAG